MNWRAAALVLLCGRALVAAAQAKVELENPGSGPGPDILVQALASPHVAVPPGLTPWLLTPGASIDHTLIVIGRDAQIEGTVHGDVIVVDADLYMHPGGRIDGRAIAIHGGVYESTLATIAGGVTLFRDFTYDISATPDGVSLSYRSLAAPPEKPGLPSLFGVHVPTYDRSNGLSLGIGPDISVPKFKFDIEPRLTYRSQLGRLDPAVTASGTLGGDVTVHASVGRGTFTNDDWIRGNLINSATYLLLGDDTRNYFRATRAEATFSRKSTSPTLTLEPYVGARWESDRSVRPGAAATGGPWAFTNRHDRDDVLRPNPAIDAGTISSFLAGAELKWTDQGIVAHARLDEEVGRSWSASHVDPDLGQFSQTTFDGTIAFPTFGTQSIRIEGHAVYSPSEPTPRQRWAYVGGSGSIPTIELLELGGDRLIYFDGRYLVPLNTLRLPFGGSPTVILREVLAGAALGTTPTLLQATGVRLAASVFYVELLADPAARRGHFSYGIAVAR